MITGNDIQSLVNLFEERQVFLYHACQLIDFQSYLHLGGIPSRALLESKQAEFTKFQTDAIDRENSVWDKVFVNLADFGESFARGDKSVPNPYGPILFQISPSALLETSDVAICLRSAGAQGFNREGEALRTVEQINRLFLYPSNVYPLSKRRLIKFGNKLEVEFEDPNAQTPEISCTVSSGVLSIQKVRLVRVAPYMVNGRSLRNWADSIKKRHGAQFSIYERTHFQDNSRKLLYNEIVEQIGEEIPSLYAITQDNTCTQPLREWARQISQGDLEWQFKRYATYLRDGTLKLMRTASLPSER
ncbi:MAG: hypothetical protein OXH39_14305 [Candidatus Poribacteria bacterium]|nr:hypothetical protein [Candidatus Poribacteria bacterium]